MWKSTIQIKSINVRKKAIETASLGDYFSVHLKWKECRPSTMCARQVFVWVKERFPEDSISLLLAVLLSDIMMGPHFFTKES